jgi:hypothetical protein
LKSFVYFAADECGTPETKFVLFYQQQDEQPGIMVDIFSLTHDSYLARKKKSQLQH